MPLRRLPFTLIPFREEDGKTYIDAPWPARALIPPGDTDIIVFNGDVVTVCVQNGFASYRKLSMHGENWRCVIGESEYLA